MGDEEMSDKSALETILESINSTTLDESSKASISKLITETVDARVSAKEKLLTEEFAKKETEIAELKTQILKEAEENEKVLVEQAELYKAELEKTVLEAATALKTASEAEITKVKELAESDKESFKVEAKKVLLEEAKAFKTKQETELVEEVKNFKAGLIDKVSDYLEAKFKETIPAEIMESAARLQVLEPLVESIMKSFSGNFIKLDTTGYKLIKEAKDEVVRLETEVQKHMKDNVVLKKEKREVERHSKIRALTEGLTQSQREKAVKLLEDVEVENLESHYTKIRDIVTEITKTTPTSKLPEKIDESVKPELKKQENKEEISKTTAAQFQMSKIINENEIKAAVKPSEKKEATPMKNWAGRIQPKYSK